MAFYRAIDYMRWFLRHLDELEPLLSLPDRLRSAKGLEAKWSILREALDRVVRVFDAAPFIQAEPAATPAEIKAMHAELEAKGIQWEAVASLVPLLFDLVELLRGIELVYGSDRS